MKKSRLPILSPEERDFFDIACKGHKLTNEQLRIIEDAIYGGRKSDEGDINLAIDVGTATKEIMEDKSIKPEEKTEAIRERLDNLLMHR